MGSVRGSRFIIPSALLVAGLLLAACTRSVARNVLPSATPETGGVNPTAPSVDATMDAAMQSTIMTQTAAAGGPTQTQPPQLPAATATQPAVVVPSATPLPPPVQPTSTAPAVQTGPTQYTVQQGDWIYQIARAFGVDPNAIIAANPGIDPNRIFPGQVLTIPAPGSTAPEPTSSTTLPRPTTYTVQKGDWVYSIARKFGVDPNAIIAANGLQPPYTVYPGQTLKIP